MTVRELIELLGTVPPDLPVCYQLHSEYCLLEPDHVHTEDLSPARDDGWVADTRPDVQTVKYLVFPGN